MQFNEVNKMLKRIEIEAKTENDALTKAQESLRIAKNKIKLEIIKEKNGILGIGKSTTYVATPNIDLGVEGKNYLEKIFEGLEIEAKMEYRILNDGDEIRYRIESEENAILIGREGRNLSAIQYLLRNYLSIFTENHIMVSLDIGDYNETRKRQLEILATKTAKEVARTKISVKLDPMNSFERRIIHSKLSEWRDVETESDGEGLERAIIIKYRK